MSTMAELLRKLNDWTQEEREVSSIEALEQLSQLDRHGGGISPPEFGELIEFASDQAGRWSARWVFSPAATPDNAAKAETDFWNRLWTGWVETLCKDIPDARDSVERGHSLMALKYVSAKRAAGFADHRIEGILANLVSRLSFFLDGMGMQHLALPLIRWAMYPAGTVGRLGLPPPSEAMLAPEELATLLLAASTAGDAEAVVRALELGADINAAPEVGTTAIMTAAANGHDSVVTLLLQMGADVSARDNLGGTALHQACANGSPSTVTLLLQAGANPDARDKQGNPAPFDSVYLENLPVLEWLLANGTDLEARNATGDTLLIMAAALGKHQVVSVLLGAGASLEGRNNSGETPLLSALSHSQEAAATNLLDQGAKTDVLDTSGAGALHHSAFGGLIALSRRLLEAGLDPNLVDGNGRTAVHIAASRGFPTVQRALVEGGGSTGLRTAEGKSLAELEAEASGLRQITEQIRLLRSLPASISPSDLHRLSDLADEAADGRDEGGHRMRVFLEDLVHAYRMYPSRTGANPLLLESIINATKGVHPGET